MSPNKESLFTLASQIELLVELSIQQTLDKRGLIDLIILEKISQLKNQSSDHSDCEADG